MPQVYTYSFENTKVTISHPQYGSYSAYGTGIGSLSISMTNDITNHQVSADGAVVVSKVIAKNGTVTFDILQSSGFNTWLKNFTNYLEASVPARFAEATMVISNDSTGVTYTCSGVSHQKKPDETYQSTSQNKSWVLMAANIEQQ